MYNNAIFIYQAISKDCGISHNTVKELISVLEASFIIFRVHPYHKNYNNYWEKLQLYYWRDNHKRELVLILDFGMKYWMKISGSDPAALFLVYAGQETFVRKNLFTRFCIENQSRSSKIDAIMISQHHRLSFKT